MILQQSFQEARQGVNGTFVPDCSQKEGAVCYRRNTMCELALLQGRKCVSSDHPLIQTCKHVLQITIK